MPPHRPADRPPPLHWSAAPRRTGPIPTRHQTRRCRTRAPHHCRCSRCFDFEWLNPPDPGWGKDPPCSTACGPGLRAPEPGPILDPGFPGWRPFPGWKALDLSRRPTNLPGYEGPGYQASPCRQAPYARPPEPCFQAPRNPAPQEHSPQPS